MESDKIQQVKSRIQDLWNSIVKGEEEGNFEENNRGKIVVFLIAFVLSLCLWLMVNLSRDYNLTVELPIELGNMPSDEALTERLPEHATVSISGEGWKLINIYNNPPPIFVDVTQNEVNLYDQVREQMNANPDLNVQKVQPLFLNLDLEEKISKKVPVVSNVNVTFEDQYGLKAAPVLEPDSVVISGAVSILRDLDRWETVPYDIENVEENISTEIALQEPKALVTITPATVTFTAEVAQYTEGETRVMIESRNMPAGRSVSFSPSFLTVTYDVPIDQYTQVQSLNTTFRAYITYSQIQQDTTGFVIPNVEQAASVDYNLRLRSFRPSRISYFTIVND